MQKTSRFSNLKVSEAFKRKVPLSESSKVDKFIEYLYQECQMQKPYLADLISDYVRLNGEVLLSISDSSGEYLIHHICTILQEGDQNIIKEVLHFILNQAQDVVEDATFDNFMRGLNLDVQVQDLQADSEQNQVGEQNKKWAKGLIQIQQINIGNALNKTPLHILAGQKKSTLLLAFLEVILDDKYSNINFNISQTDSSSRTFMHILLENNLLSTYEKISMLYGDRMNLENFTIIGENLFDIYKRLKIEKLQKAKAQLNYNQYIDEIYSVDLRVFKDRKALLFDSEPELGTNILSELVNNQKADQFFKLLAKIMQEVEEIITTPSADGQSVITQVIQRFDARNFETFLEKVGFNLIRPEIKNSKTNQNLLHLFLRNGTVTPEERLKMYKRLKLLLGENKIKEFSNEIDSYGNLPINYHLQSLKRFGNSDEDLAIFEEIVKFTNLTKYDYQDKRSQLRQDDEKLESIQKKRNEHEKDRKDNMKGKKKLFITRRVHLWNKYKAKTEQRRDYNYPVDVAIKLQSVKVLKVLITNKHPSTILTSSQLILAFKTQSEEVIEYLLSVVQQMTEDQRQRLLSGSLQGLVDIHRNYLQQCIDERTKVKNVDNLILGMTKERYQELYSKLIESIFVTFSFGPGWNFLETNISTVIEEDHEDIRAKYTPYSTKGILKTGLFKLPEMDQAFDLGYLCNLMENWPLLRALKPVIESRVDEKLDDKRYFYLKLLEQHAVRHNKKAIREVIQIFPQILEFVESQDDEGMQRFLIKLQNKMLNKFKNIVDTDVFEFLNQEIRINIRNNFDQDEYNTGESNNQELFSNIQKSKILSKCDLYFKPTIRSQAKRQKGQDDSECISFLKLKQMRLNFLKTLQKQDLSLLGLLLVQSHNFESKETKDLFADFLIEVFKQGTFFKIVKIYDTSHQKVMKNLVEQISKRKDWGLLNKFLDNLYVYLQQNTSFYPINYKAEVSQFDFNYPYRQSKIQSLARKYNFKGDKYPYFLGTSLYSEFNLNDEQEDECRSVYEGYLKARQNDQRFDERIVPNGLAILFDSFNSLNVQKILVNSENLDEVLKLVEKVIDLNGMPFIEIANFQKLEAAESQRDKLMKLKQLAKILHFFNLEFKAGTLQSILHTIAEQGEDLPEEYLKRFAQSEHILCDSLNSYDYRGFSPLVKSIQFKNWTFMETMLRYNKMCVIIDIPLMETKNNKLVTEQLNRIQGHYTLMALTSAIQKLSAEDQLRVVCLIGKWLQEWLPEREKKQYIHIMRTSLDYFFRFFGDKTAFQREDMGNIEEGRDVPNIYKEKNDEQQVHRINTILQYHAIYFELNKIDEAVSNKRAHKLFMEYLGAIYSLVIQYVASSLTLEQYENLKSNNIDLANFLVDDRQFHTREAHQKQILAHILDPCFPFTTTNDILVVYLLKMVIIKQPENFELAERIFEDMDLKFFSKFTLEIACFVGKYFGTQNKIFQKLAHECKCYLCGKELTVETPLIETLNPVIKNGLPTFEDYLPKAIYDFYEEEAYQDMIVEFFQILLQNDEEELAQTFLTAQNKIFVTPYTIQGLQRMAMKYLKVNLILQIGYIITFSEQEQAKHLEDLDAIVTIQDAIDQRAFKRAVTERNDDNDQSKERPRLFDFMTDEQVELLFSSHLNNLGGRVDFRFKQYCSQKDKKETLLITLQQIVRKITPELFTRYVEYASQNYQDPKMRFKFIKAMTQCLRKSLKLNGQITQSKNHQAIRLKQQKEYLLSKVAQIAKSDKYYKIIANPEQSNELREAMNIDQKSFTELLDKVTKLRTEYEKLRQVKLPYRYIKSFIEVGHVIQNTRSTGKKNETSSQLMKQLQPLNAGKPTHISMASKKKLSQVQEIQNYTPQQIQQMSAQDLAKSTPHTIKTHEIQKSVSTKLASNTRGKIDIGKASTIKDRDILQQKEDLQNFNQISQNLKSFSQTFSLDDTSLYIQEFEELMINQKIRPLIQMIEEEPLTLKQLIKIDDNLERNYQSAQSGGLFIFEFKKALAERIEDFMLTKIEQTSVEELLEREEAFQDDIQSVIRHRSNIIDTVKQQLENKTNPYQEKKAIDILTEVVQVGIYERILKQYLRLGQRVEVMCFDNLKFIKTQEIYQALREKFFYPFIETKIIERNFIFQSNELSEAQRFLFDEKFMHIIFTIFKYDDEELQRKILLSEKVMSLISIGNMITIFLVLTTKPLNNPNFLYVGTLLKLMILHLTEATNISNFSHSIQEAIREHQLPVLKSEAINFRLSSQRVENIYDPVAHLIKLGRFTSAKDYLAENRPLTLEIVLTMILHGEKDKPFLQWILQRYQHQAAAQSEVNQDRKLKDIKTLFSWMLSNRISESVMQMVQDTIGEDLLEIEIRYAESLDKTIEEEKKSSEARVQQESVDEEHEDRQEARIEAPEVAEIEKHSILHYLLQNSYYKETDSVIKRATQNQLQRMVCMSRLFEGMDQSNSFICPYSVALANSQYDLLDSLLPPQDKLKQVIKTGDLLIIRDFLFSEKCIMTTSRGSGERIALISKIMTPENNFGKDVTQGKKKNYELIKKLLLVPSIILIIHEIPSCQYKKVENEDEQNNDQEQGEQVTLNLKAKIELELRSCYGISVALDAFILNTGLDLDATFIASCYQNNLNQLLVLIEKGITIQAILNINRHTQEYDHKNLELLLKPFSYLKERGLIKVLEDKEVLEAEEKLLSHPIIQLLKTNYKDKIYDQHESFIFHLLGAFLTETAKKGFQPHSFSFNYYLLEAHKHFGVQQDLLDVFVDHYQWHLCNGTLENDLIMLDQILYSTIGNYEDYEGKFIQIFKFEMIRKYYDYSLVNQSQLDNERVSKPHYLLNNLQMVKNRVFTIFRNSKGEEILNNYSAKELAKLIILLAQVGPHQCHRLRLARSADEPIKVEESKELQDSSNELETLLKGDTCKVKEDRFKPELIISWYLDNAVILRSNSRLNEQPTDSSDFEALIFKLRLLSEAIQLIEAILPSYQSHGQQQSKSLAELLSHKMAQIKLVKEAILQIVDPKMLLSVPSLNLDNSVTPTTFHSSHGFKFTIEISKTILHQIQSQAPNQGDGIKRIILELEYKATAIRRLIEFAGEHIIQIQKQQSQSTKKQTKKQDKGDSLYEITLDFEVQLMGRSSLSKIKDWTYFLLINHQDLVDLESGKSDLLHETIGKELHTSLLRDKVKAYLLQQVQNAQTYQFSENDLIQGIKEVCLVSSNDIIEQFSPQQMQAIGNIIDQSVQADTSNSFTKFPKSSIIDLCFSKAQVLATNYDKNKSKAKPLLKKTIHRLELGLVSSVNELISFENKFFGETIQNVGGYIASENIPLVQILFCFDLKRQEIVVSENLFLPISFFNFYDLNQELKTEVKLGTLFNQVQKNKKLKFNLSMSSLCQQLINDKLKSQMAPSESLFKVTRKFLSGNPFLIQTLQKAIESYKEQMENTVCMILEFKYLTDYDLKAFESDESQKGRKIVIVDVEYGMESKPQEDDDPSSDYQFRGDITGVITLHIASR